MQSCKEKNKRSSDVFKEPKLALLETRCPKNMPTYVVAFAVHETFDDFPTTQQMLCNKRSLQGSINSITPSNSTRTLDLTEITEIRPPQNTANVSNNEIKIEINLDENECGDIEKTPEINRSYHIVNNNLEDSTNEQPQIIFNAIKYKRKSNNAKFSRKKPKKYKRIVKIKNIHFKYENIKHTLTKRLDKRLRKAKMKPHNCKQIQKGLYSDSISKVITRTRVLKKALAKENLQDNTDRISLTDYIKFNDNGSIASSPSTARKSLISYSSENTLTLKGSSFHMNDFNMSSVNSVIQIASDCIVPYKTDIINVAVAVAFNPNKMITEKSPLVPNDSNLGESLTSNETVYFPGSILTSEIPSTNTANNVNEDFMNDNDMSMETLMSDKKSSLDMSIDDDTFFIANTCSDFNKPSNHSSNKYTSSDSTLVHVEYLQQSSMMTHLKNDITCKPTTLLDTVINLEMFSQIDPTTGFDGQSGSELNDVIISGMNHLTFSTKNDRYQANEASKGIGKQVIKKPFELDNSTNHLKSISLPNDAEIKAIIKEGDNQPKITCTQESKIYYPSNIPEMWDKLLLVIDLAIKRLEDTLSEKMIKELNKAMTVFEQNRSSPQADFTNTETKVILSSIAINEANNISRKEAVVTKETNNEVEECIQCDLVNNNVIDQIMLKLSMEYPKLQKGCSTTTLRKHMSPKLDDYLEGKLLPDVESPILDEIKTLEMVTVSTAPVTQERFDRFTRFHSVFRGLIMFFRENLIVLTTVPSFFILILCVYSAIVVLMKPW